MSVVLRIMSGARQGESAEFEADDFSLGGQPDCDVVFDPDEDRGARGTRIEVRRDDDQWQVRRLEGKGVLINQEFLDTVLPIRCGDVIRMSPDGPEIRFLVASAPEEAAAAGPFPSAARSATRPDPADPATDLPASCATERPAGLGLSWRRPAFGAAALIAALLLVMLGALWGRDSEAPVVSPPEVAGPPEPQGKQTPKPAPKPPGPVENGAEAKGEDPPARAPAKPPSPIAVLAIKSKGGYQPFGVAAPVEDSGGRRMLLTTARLGGILSYWSTKSMRFWAAFPGMPGEATRFVPIDGRCIFRHRLYVEAISQGDAQGAAYFDVAILACAGELPSSCVGKLAARGAAGALAPGSRLTVSSVSEPRLPTHQSRAPKWNPPHEIKVARMPVSVKQVIPLDEDALAGDTRHLLVLDAGKDSLREGSPVFNKEGEVVAICAQPPRAVAVDRELIGSLWERGQGKQWIAEYAAPAPAVKP